MKVRGFEVVNEASRKFPEQTISLPIRGDKGSAGYDFFSNETVTIAPEEKHIFWTDIKSYMQEDEVLNIHVRSSIGIKKGLLLCNGTGIIDSSYYSNPGNDGNIGIAIKNFSTAPVEITAGERVAQGIFQKYLVADTDILANESRVGGIGSTGR
ncbi:dCTP deaminase/dUTPase family protein [Listeria welshimeri]|uniref:dUTP diphosphatase n=1 Tax=Listeria welshimeri TaxID=1643 RepID=UPI0018897760|nr:dUTP diphosphatase [Listeria welshimeri]MBF2429810.1 dUTP diphosphatase [Listeria welshimeri]